MQGDTAQQADRNTYGDALCMCVLNCRQSAPSNQIPDFSDFFRKGTSDHS